MLFRSGYDYTLGQDISLVIDVSLFPNASAPGENETLPCYVKKTFKVCGVIREFIIATFTFILTVTLIVMQFILKLHNGNGCISAHQEKITVIIAIILALSLIPLYYFPY